MTTARRFRFGDFELDEGLLELRCSGQPIQMEPKPLRLLLYLIHNRDRVVHKEALLEAVWRNEVVGDAALAGALRDVRRALGDDGAEQRWIRTRRRVGYQFIGPVEIPGAPDRQKTEKKGLYGAPRGLSMSFVSRADELRELEAMLTQQTYLHVHVSIEGLAGVGKTEIALQLVHKLAHEEAFPGGIFWLDAGSRALGPAWGTVIADQYGIPPAPIQERCAELVRRLQDVREPILVVLDNVESWAPETWPEPLPAGSHVRILVTTRTRNLAGAQFRHVRVGMLEPPYDRELVLRFAGREASPALDALLEHLGGHALALELAGAFLGSYPGESPCSYLDELKRDPDAVEGEVMNRVRYERTVTQSFRTVWDRLTEPVREAWWLASFFEPEPVQRELALACGMGGGALRRLEDLHVIQSGSNGRWTMHRLARDFGQRSFPATRRALQLLLGMGPQLIHRNHAAEELRNVYQRAVEFAEQTDEHEEVFLALEGLWHTTGLHGDWLRSREIARSIEELAQKHDMSLYWISAFRARGSACFYTGRLEEACSCLENGISLYRANQLERFRSLLHPGVFMLWHAGHAQCLSGWPEQGLKLIEEASELAAQLGDPALLAMDALSRARLHQFRSEIEDVEKHAMRLMEIISSTHALPVFRHVGALMAAWARIARDPLGSSWELASMRESFAAMMQLNLRIVRTFSLGLVADACARLNRRKEGLDAVDEAMRVAQTMGERFFEAELWRIRAALCDSSREAIQSLERALAVAAGQGARWFELRAATDLVAVADTPELRGRTQELLKRTYGSFTEGFALADLERARAALAAL